LLTRTIRLSIRLTSNLGGGTVGLVRHATTETLAGIDPLLRQIRRIPGLQERKTGTFYRKSKAFLHFHEDPAGLFADVKVDGDWERMPVNGAAERRRLLRRLEELAAG